MRRSRIESPKLCVYALAAGTQSGRRLVRELDLPLLTSDEQQKLERAAAKLRRRAERDSRHEAEQAHGDAALAQVLEDLRQQLGPAGVVAEDELLAELGALLRATGSRCVGAHEVYIAQGLQLAQLESVHGLRVPTDAAARSALCALLAHHPAVVRAVRDGLAPRALLAPQSGAATGADAASRGWTMGWRRC